MDSKYLHYLKKLYFKAENNANAVPMQNYMKNRFTYLGIKSPERKEIYKTFFKENGLPDFVELEPIIKELWTMAEREYQYFAITLIEKMIKKANPEIIGLLEYLLVNKSWWDSVDGIASNLVGTLFNNYPDMIDDITYKWMNSGNIWLQRTCILFQLKYKRKTDFELLTKFIVQCSGSNEFFIQKAIGWALREYSKTNPETVIEFIRNNQLKPLSVREGLKRANLNN